MMFSSYDKSYVIGMQKNWEDRIMIERLFQAVEEMIQSIVPLEVEKYITEHMDKIVMDIQTMVNGKSVNSEGLIEEIKNIIIKELNV